MRRFVPFLLVLFVIAAILRIDFFFTVVYLFAGVYALSHLWTRTAAEHLRVHRRFVDHAFPGDQVTVETTVQNDGWLPIPGWRCTSRCPGSSPCPPFIAG